MLGKKASETGNKYHALSEGRDCYLEQIMLQAVVMKPTEQSISNQLVGGANSLILTEADQQEV